MPGFDPSLAESLSAHWAALHRDCELIIRADELHRLRMLALAADDDLVSLLLLRKLRMARTVDGTALLGSLVSLNSFCKFSFDGGGNGKRQLVQPTSFMPRHGLSILSLAGAGLIGLRARQEILWPREDGSLCDLRVERVWNRPRPG